MYITVNNKNYEIRLGKLGSSIHIKEIKNNLHVLSIPMDLRESELIQYVQINHAKMVSEYKKENKIDLFAQIELYTKIFIIKADNNTTNSYKIDQYIYSSLSTKSAVNIKKICLDIVFQDISKLVGIWEDRLDIILGSIYLKNFKKSLFKISKLDKSISFSTNLMKYNFTFVEFIIAKAIFEYLNMHEVIQNNYMEDFVKDYKQSIKILEYERKNGF